MTQEKRGIIEKYSEEIRDIGSKLKDLENGRVYEISRVQTDGSLATNIVNLRKMISELLSKIDNQKESVNDMLAEFFEKKE